VESRDFCAVLGRKEEFNISCWTSEFESVPVEEIIERYPALSETIKENPTSFMEKLCKIGFKLDEKLRVFHEWKEKLGEL
jgi:hypothetical protein